MGALNARLRKTKFCGSRGETASPQLSHGIGKSPTPWGEIPDSVVFAPCFLTAFIRYTAVWELLTLLLSSSAK